jgi:phosphoribosylanthranilate isomerase
MTWIKICGTTNLEDAQICVAAGADALGFIFAESPRRITPAAAAGIISKLPKKLDKIGVFAGQRPEYIHKTSVESCVTGVQFQQKHGPELAEKLKSEIPGLIVTKVESAPEMLQRLEKATGFALPHETQLWIDRLMFDNAGGGTGRTFDWKKSQGLIRGFRIIFDKIIVAGGLTPGNVGEAIRILRPWGVDVVTGVEREPGKKDPDKVKAFIEAVRRADQELASQ